MKESEKGNQIKNVLNDVFKKHVFTDKFEKLLQESLDNLPFKATVTNINSNYGQVMFMNDNDNPNVVDFTVKPTK